MSDRLFGTDCSINDSQSQMELLETIRVPKNLMYLTGRLPKPKYKSIDPKDQLRQQTTEYKLRIDNEDNKKVNFLSKQGSNKELKIVQNKQK